MRSRWWLVLVLSWAACTERTQVRPEPSPTAPEQPLPPPGPLAPQRPAPPAPGSALVVPERLAGADPARAMSLHFLNIGQGSATLIEFPCAAVLVDTGGELNEQFDSNDALLRQLETFFARRTDLARTLALLVITHPHIDHMRGIPVLLEHFTVKNVVDDGLPGDELVREPMMALREYISTHGTGYRAVLSTEVPEGGLHDEVVDPVACADVDPDLRILAGRYEGDPGWGNSEYDSAHFKNANNHSVVMRVAVGRSSVLITGDLEVPSIRTLVTRYAGTGLLDTDVYVVGHHGSRNGTTPELLEHVTPRVAVMSCGPSARHLPWTAYQYGHPRAVVVDQLNRSTLMQRTPVEVEVADGVKRFREIPLGTAIYATGWDGAVNVHMLDDGRIAVRTARDAKRNIRPD